MPYIKKDMREYIKSGLALPTSAGEVNYKISEIIHTYLIRKGGVNYTNINEVIGILECAKLELYRKLAAGYEDIKQQENGSVSTLDEVKSE